MSRCGRPCRIEAAIEAVNTLPDGCSMDDRVYLVTQILEGQADAEAGRLMSTDELLKEVEEWGT